MKIHETDCEVGVEKTDGMVHAACSQLRFAEGLRRRWREARAEAAIQEAVGISFIEGVRLPAADLRVLVSQADALDQVDAGEAQTLGIWRAVWEIEQQLPALNQREPSQAGAPRAVPAVLAGINRDVCSYLVAAGFLSPASVAVPREPTVLRRLLALSAEPETAALHKATESWRLIVSNQLFEVGSGATGVIFAKWMLARSGVEPTGVAVLSDWPSRNRSIYAGIVNDHAAPNAAWSELVNRCVVDGCAAGEEVARSVQAGRFPTR